VCSLRRCAPQRPIAEPRLLLRLTTCTVKILCSTKRPCSTVVEQRILTVQVVKRNNNLGSAIGRCGAHRRKLRTTFWHVYYFFIGITSIALDGKNGKISVTFHFSVTSVTFHVSVTFFYATNVFNIIQPIFFNIIKQILNIISKKRIFLVQQL
jgi:hypothetical protein